MLLRRCLPWLLVGFLVVASSGGALAQGSAPGGPGAPAALAGTGFTYQGKLTNGSGPVTATCSFQFSLWDAAGSGTPPTGGTQIGATQTLLNVSVAAGDFTVILNDTAQFGAGAFTGQARWLAVAAECPPDVSYTTLSPRQPLTAAPYALYALSGGTTYTAGAGLVLTSTTFALDPSYTDGRYWKLSGNAGTTANNFLGTTDNMTLTLGAGGTAALRLVPNVDGPDVIGGTSGNSVTGVNTGGVTIFGGGPALSGYENTVQGTNVTYATISGGVQNTISGTVYHGTIGGGYGNTIAGPTLFTVASEATIGGGIGNNVSGWKGTIAGGESNIVTGTDGFVGGGAGNRANGYTAVVGGGGGNTASSGGATVGGGGGNTASNTSATVPGGEFNTAGGFASFAAGDSARAVNDGAFVWADSIGFPLTSTANNEFLVRATGGITLYTSSNATSGASLYPGSGSWNVLSDRNMKANFGTVDGLQVLDALAGIPIQTWNYKTQGAAIRHMGPMAQDFKAAFGVGENDTTISTVDAQGVALAAIQGLYTVVQQKDAQISALRDTSVNQQAQIAALNTRVTSLESRAAASAGQPAPAQLPLALPWLLLAGLVLLNVGAAAGYLAARARKA